MGSLDITEIRSTLCDLDSKAAEVLEFVEYKDSLLDNEVMSDLIQCLNDLQEHITNVQENQNWI